MWQSLVDFQYPTPLLDKDSTMWPKWLVWIYKKLFGASPIFIDTTRLHPDTDYTIALSFGGDLQGAHHLAMWLPAFESVGVDFCIITRNRNVFNYCVAQYPHIATVFARKGQHVHSLLEKLPHIRAIFYMSNVGTNIHTVRINNSIKQIFIGHGDSEKASSVTKVFRLYDEVWTAGQAHIDRFAKASLDASSIKFVKTGRPNLKNTLLQCSAPWQERFSSPTILYLPTWEGLFYEKPEESYSSIPIGAELLHRSSITLKCTISAKLHPSTGSKSKKYAQFRSQFSAMAQKTPALTLHEQHIRLPSILDTANIFVCDISGALTECLAANAPIFLFKNPMARCAESAMPHEYFTYQFSSVDEFLVKLARVLAGEDPLAEGRLEAMEYYLGRTFTVTDTFQMHVRREASRRLPHERASP